MVLERKRHTSSINQVSHVDMQEPKSDYIELRAGVLRLQKIQGDKNEVNEAFDMLGSSFNSYSFSMKGSKMEECNPGPSFYES
jgi:hypothetical protein